MLVKSESSSTVNVSSSVTGILSFIAVTVTVRVPVALRVPSDTVYVIVSVPS